MEETKGIPVTQSRSKEKDSKSYSMKVGPFPETTDADINETLEQFINALKANNWLMFNILLTKLTAAKQTKIHSAAIKKESIETLEVLLHFLLGLPIGKLEETSASKQPNIIKRPRRGKLRRSITKHALEPESIKYRESMNLGGFDGFYNDPSVKTMRENFQTLSFTNKHSILETLRKSLTNLIHDGINGISDLDAINFLIITAIKEKRSSEPLAYFKSYQNTCLKNLEKQFRSDTYALITVRHNHTQLWTRLKTLWLKQHDTAYAPSPSKSLRSVETVLNIPLIIATLALAYQNTSENTLYEDQHIPNLFLAFTTYIIGKNITKTAKDYSAEQNAYTVKKSGLVIAAVCKSAQIKGIELNSELLPILKVTKIKMDKNHYEYEFAFISSPPAAEVKSTTAPSTYFGPASFHYRPSADKQGNLVYDKPEQKTRLVIDLSKILQCSALYDSEHPDSCTAFKINFVTTDAVCVLAVFTDPLKEAIKKIDGLFKKVIGISKRLTLVSADGQQGIKKVEDNIHELKILGEYGDYRLLGFTRRIPYEGQIILVYYFTHCMDHDKINSMIPTLKTQAKLCLAQDEELLSSSTAMTPANT